MGASVVLGGSTLRSLSSRACSTRKNARGCRERSTSWRRVQCRPSASQCCHDKNNANAVPIAAVASTTHRPLLLTTAVNTPTPASEARSLNA